jgi:hypothetical protein
MWRFSIISFGRVFSRVIVAGIFCLQAFLVMALASSTSTPAFARASDVPKCRLNADVAAYLRGAEDAADQVAVIEPPAAAPPPAPGAAIGSKSGPPASFRSAITAMAPSISP